MHFLSGHFVGSVDGRQWTKKYRYLLALLVVFLGAAVGVGLWVFYLYLSLPPVAWLKYYRPVELTPAAYARAGKLSRAARPRLRYDLPLTCIPKRLRQAFIAAEDSDFWHEGAVDYDAVLRAAYVDLSHWSLRQGASTITQQVARNLFLSTNKTATRKVKQILIAHRLDADLSKSEILDLYLNMIYLGQGAYGVQAASCVYYGKPVWRLTLPQMAMLAGLPAAPSYLNPITDPALAAKRRAYVLRRMAALGYISRAEARAAMSAPLATRYHPQRLTGSAPSSRCDCPCHCSPASGAARHGVVSRVSGISSADHSFKLR